MRAYSETDIAPQAVELLAAWNKAYGAYIQGVDQHKQLIDSDSGAQATLLNGQTLEPRYLEALSTLKRLKETQRQAGAEMNQSVSARADRSNMIVAGTVLVALVLGLGVSGTLAWVIAGSTTQVTKAARGLAQGDLDQQVNVRSRDELGELAAAFREMMEYLQEMADVAGAVARGDLSRTIQPKSERDVLGTAFQGMIADLRGLVAQVQEAAAAVAEASGQLGPAAAQASDAVEQVSGAVRGIADGAHQTSASAQTGYEAMDQLARAIEGIARGAGDQAQQVQAASGIAAEMAASVQRVSTSTGQVAQVSADTRSAAQSGARAVRETVDGMHEIKAVVTQVAGRVEELGKLGQKIGAVVNTIDDIAEQTNLLALNAAIEAARAGEHGRGFAVVADEVRKLAERSQSETKAIAQLITDVRNGTRDAVKAMESGSAKVQLGVRLADQAGDALAQILSAVDATVDQIDGIASAARELEAGAVAVVEAMEGISAVVEENTATSEEMAAESTHVTEAIQSISAVAEENSAVTREVSASAEQMSAQVQRIGGQASDLSATAEHLRSLVARFTLEAAAAANESVEDGKVELRRAA
jgi:methyl-accepting chemotaxis protein